MLPPVDYNEPVPQQQAEEKKTPTGEALSPDSRNKGTSARGTTKRSKRGKLPKTGEAPMANPLPNLAALTLAAYALFAEEKRRRKKAEYKSHTSLERGAAYAAPLFDFIYRLLTGHLHIYMVKIKIGLRYFAITIDA